MSKKIEKANKDDKMVSDFQSELSDFFENMGVKVGSLEEEGQVPYWINTGSYAFNWIISDDFFGGFPGTKCILISGDPGKGKSFLLDAVLGNNIRMGGNSCKIMIESAANFKFTSQIVGSDEIAKKITVLKANTDEKGKVLPITVERLTSILYKTIDMQGAKKEKKNNSIVFGIDSVTQLTSEKELEGIENRISGKKESKDMTSAVKMRELFRAIEQKMELTNVTVIGIGQLTANIQTGWVPVGTPTKTVNTKGSGFAYASSLTVQMVNDKEIVDDKTNTPVGIKMKLKTTKNRFQIRGRDCWLYFYFARGIDPFGGLPDLLAKYDVVKPVKVKENKKGELKEAKATPSTSGEYDDDVTFIFINKDGVEVRFTKNNISEIVDEEMLKEINLKLNDIYQDILKKAGINKEQELLKSDDPEDAEIEMEEGDE